MKYLLLAVATCYSINDIKNNVCYQYCRKEKGVEYGYYIINKDSCSCGEEVPYEDVTHQTFKLAPVRAKIFTTNKNVFFYQEREHNE